MDKNKEIGLRIEEARKEKGMSLQDVADKVSVARSTIQRYEQGTIKAVKLPVVEAIANALGVNPAWVVGKSQRKYDSTTLPHAEYREVLSEDGIRLLLDADSKIPQEHLDEIVEFIKFKQQKYGR